jgi:ArsR family transcriptional regulator
MPGPIAAQLGDAFGLASEYQMRACPRDLALMAGKCWETGTDRQHVKGIDKGKKRKYISKKEYSGGLVKAFIKVMKALSDPNRVKILKLLQHRTLCVCELQKALGISQPNASKHIKILENAGLISFFKEGLWVNCRLSDGRDSPYAAALLGNLRHWLEKDAEVTALAAMIPELDRNLICKGDKAPCNITKSISVNALPWGNEQWTHEGDGHEHRDLSQNHRRWIGPRR